MKKIILSLLLIFNCFVFAEDISPYDDFKVSCFEKIWQVSLSGTTKVVSPEKIDVFIKNSKIVPWKLYKKMWEIIDYNINLSGNKTFLQDGNLKTFLILDTDKTTTINISFNKILEEDTFKLHFVVDSQYYIPEFYISIDWRRYSKVKHLTNFSFKYLKIKFVPKNPNKIIREKIKISELFFYSKFYTYIVDSFWEVQVYVNNLCKKYFYLKNLNWNFSISSTTPTIRLYLNPNPDFNPNAEIDTDKDGILDKEDNCPKIFNPDQKDSNADWIWDMCSDVDKDGIIGYKDNCPYVYNPNQEDVNNNMVWDVCEFDKDKDWIPDGIDNCINTPNPDQKDLDQDKIWDACDNCKYYNPQQLDRNNNWIWDVCEEKEKYLKEHDKDKDGILDKEDNCPKIFNPDQKDLDGDWVWDACDNCKNIDNPKQIDKDKNWVWDMCEDADKDGYIWYQDNCPYISNPDQKDSNNDGVGDVCEDPDHDEIVNANDNCPYIYNPDQKDIDKDGLWDVCDKKDDRFLESNKYVFMSLLVLLVVLFSVCIYVMLRKMKE